MSNIFYFVMPVSCRWTTPCSKQSNFQQFWLPPGKTSQPNLARGTTGLMSHTSCSCRSRDHRSILCSSEPPHFCSWGPAGTPMDVKKQVTAGTKLLPAMPVGPLSLRRLPQVPSATHFFRFNSIPVVSSWRSSLVLHTGKHSEFLFPDFPTQVSHLPQFHDFSFLQENLPSGLNDVMAKSQLSTSLFSWKQIHCLAMYDNIYIWWHQCKQQQSCVKTFSCALISLW